MRCWISTLFLQTCDKLNVTFILDNLDTVEKVLSVLTSAIALCLTFIINYISLNTHFWHYLGQPGILLQISQTVLDVMMWVQWKFPHSTQTALCSTSILLIVGWYRAMAVNWQKEIDVTLYVGPLSSLFIYLWTLSLPLLSYHPGNVQCS